MYYDLKELIIFIYRNKLYAMRTFTELHENDIITESTVFKRLADKIGSAFGEVVAKYDNAKKDLANFSKNTKNAFNSTVISMSDDPAVSDKFKTDVVDSIVDTPKDKAKSIQRLKEIVMKFKDDKNYLESNSYVYTLKMLKSLAEEANDEDTVKLADEILDKVPEDKKKENTKPEGETVSKEEVVKKTNNSVLNDFIELANINKSNLDSEVWKLARDKSKWKLDDINNVIVGLSTLFISLTLLEDGSTEENNEFIETTLKAFGIEDGKSFIKKIRKVAK